MISCDVHQDQSNPIWHLHDCQTEGQGVVAFTERLWTSSMMNAATSSGLWADVDPWMCDCMINATSPSVQYNALVVSSLEVSLAILYPTVLSFSSICPFSLTRTRSSRAKILGGWAQIADRASSLPFCKSNAPLQEEAQGLASPCRTTDGNNCGWQGGNALGHSQKSLPFD